VAINCQAGSVLSQSAAPPTIALLKYLREMPDFRANSNARYEANQLA